MHFKRTTAPATEPVTLTQVKAALEITSSDWDTMLTELITDAREEFEEDAQISLITQTWTGYARDFNGPILLQKGPFQSVTSVKYTVTTEADTTVSSANYKTGLNGSIGIIDPADSWPTTDADFPEGVQVVFVTGYGDTADVPGAIKRAIIQKVSELFEHRTINSNRPLTMVKHGDKTYYDRIVDRYKVYAR